MRLDREKKLLWLGRYRRAYMRVVDIENELASIAGLKVKRLTGIPGAEIHTSLDSTIIRQEQLKSEYEIACKELKEIKEELVSAIDSIQDETAARVMYLRYIGLYDWEAIGDLVHYAERSVRRYHRLGLDSINV